jgi:putative tryptophan/tyrosine transport system substrate-binding protein
MRRREFIKVMSGSAVAWPLSVRAQQSAVPVVGFISAARAQGYERQVGAFLTGLAEVGFVDGQNVTVEYRWADGQNDRLPNMAADLVRRQVRLIAAVSTPAALAAKAASKTIPIVFWVGGNPTELGLVQGLNRPGGNLTGVTTLNTELEPKRLELLHELMPTTSIIALLVNPTSPTLAESTRKDLHTAAISRGFELQVLNASTEHELDTVFAKLRQLRVGGLVIGSDAFFSSQMKQLGALAIRYGVPAIYQYREFAVDGGLMSYGSSLAEALRQTGIYTGRVLKGEKPADLPVQQVTKIELVINLKTAKALGITFPISLLGRADEVIE